MASDFPRQVRELQIKGETDLQWLCALFVRQESATEFTWAVIVVVDSHYWSELKALLIFRRARHAVIPVKHDSSADMST